MILQIELHIIYWYGCFYSTCNLSEISLWVKNPVELGNYLVAIAPIPKIPWCFNLHPQSHYAKLLISYAKLLLFQVYKGYVDDPRNTDNAWVESSAINYHDSLGTSFSKFPLRSKDVGAGETVAAEWIALSKNINLYGNHEWILEKVCFHRHAFNPFTTHTKQTSLALAE